MTWKQSIQLFLKLWTFADVIKCSSKICNINPCFLLYTKIKLFLGRRRRSNLLKLPINVSIRLKYVYILRLIGPISYLGVCYVRMTVTKCIHEKMTLYFHRWTIYIIEYFIPQFQLPGIINYLYKHGAPPYHSSILKKAQQFHYLGEGWSHFV